jgi:hypothetical protein
LPSHKSNQCYPIANESLTTAAPTTTTTTTTEKIPNDFHHLARYMLAYITIKAAAIRIKALLHVLSPSGFDRHLNFYARVPLI